MAQNWRFLACWAKFFAEEPLEGLCWASFFADRQSWAWPPAPLLAVLTLRCAATPYGWHGGQPARATTHRANVRMKGPRPPPIGLTCAGCVHRGGAWRARRLPVPSISPGKRQRWDPEGSRLSLRAVAALSTPKSRRRKVGAEKSAPETQRPSLSSATVATVASRRMLSSSTSP